MRAHVDYCHCVFFTIPRIDGKGNGVSFKHIKGGILSKEHLDQNSGTIIMTNNYSVSTYNYFFDA